jgi:hypothetical protein
MQINHVCQSCGELMEVHEHGSWLEVKACTRTVPALCPQCASWPEVPSNEARYSADFCNSGTKATSSGPKI